MKTVLFTRLRNAALHRWDRICDTPAYVRGCRTILDTFTSIISSRWSEDERTLYRHLLMIEQERHDAMFKDKLGLGATGKAQPAFVDDDFAGKYPILAQFMCAIVDDDGKTRQTSTVNIFVEMGVVKASLRERDHALTLWVTSGSVEGIFEALEDALNKNPPEWRAQAQDGTTRRVRA